MLITVSTVNFTDEYRATLDVPDDQEQSQIKMVRRRWNSVLSQYCCVLKFIGPFKVDGGK